MLRKVSSKGVEFKILWTFYSHQRSHITNTSLHRDWCESQCWCWWLKSNLKINLSCYYILKCIMQCMYAYTFSLLQKEYFTEICLRMPIKGTQCLLVGKSFPTVSSWNEHWWQRNANYFYSFSQNIWLTGANYQLIKAYFDVVLCTILYYLLKILLQQRVICLHNIESSICLAFLT